MGKFFICTTATSLRLMLRRPHDNESTEVKIPFNSMDCLMAKLRSLKADKRKTANAWILRAISKNATKVTLVGFCWCAQQRTCVNVVKVH